MTALDLPRFRDLAPVDKCRKRETKDISEIHCTAVGRDDTLIITPENNIAKTLTGGIIACPICALGAIAESISPSEIPHNEEHTTKRTKKMYVLKDLFGIPEIQNINDANIHGCRITPNVFTTTEELDILVEALKEMAA